MLRAVSGTKFGSGPEVAKWERGRCDRKHRLGAGQDGRDNEAPGFGRYRRSGRPAGVVEREDLCSVLSYFGCWESGLTFAVVQW